MKNIILAAVISLTATAAAAQTPTPAPAVAPSSPSTYTFTFSADATIWISKGLDELPAKIANPIFQEMARQINEQNEAFKKAHEAPKAADQKHDRLAPSTSSGAPKKEKEK